MIEKLPKFNYGKVQPVSFDDGMTLYEEVGKIANSQNNLIDMFNKEDFTNIVHQDDLVSIRQNITNNSNDIESLSNDAVLKSELLQEPVRTGNQALSAYAAMKYTDDEIDKITTDYVKSENVKQTLGTSETDVMSQKAITKALSNINNTTIVNETFVDNSQATTSWIGVRHNILSLPNYTQTATGTITSSSKPLPASLVTITSRDKDNIEIDTTQMSITTTSPYNFNIVLSPNVASITLSGQSSTNTTYTTTLNYQKVVDNTLLQTTGNSTTQAMSQKAVTDAINATGYDVMVISDFNEKLPGAYAAYETNTQYIMSTDDSNNWIALTKIGNYKLGVENITGTASLSFKQYEINPDDTFTLVSDNFSITKRNTRSNVSGDVYSVSYINNNTPYWDTSAFAAKVENVQSFGNLQYCTCNWDRAYNKNCFIAGSLTTVGSSIVKIICGEIRSNKTGYFWAVSGSLPSTPFTISFNNLIIIPITNT